MKLLLVTFIFVAAIALNICETNALPADMSEGGAAERGAPAMAGKFSISDIAHKAVISQRLSQNLEFISIQTCYRSVHVQFLLWPLLAWLILYEKMSWRMPWELEGTPS